MQMSCSGNYKQYAERPPHGRPDPPENCLITPFKRKSVKTLSLSVLKRAREAPSELIRTYIIVFNFFFLGGSVTLIFEIGSSAGEGIEEEIYCVNKRHRRIYKFTASLPMIGNSQVERIIDFPHAGVCIYIDAPLLYIRRYLLP